MRILQINTVCGIGSTGRICTDLLETLQNKGDECYICYGRDTPPEKYKQFAKRVNNKFDTIINVLETRIWDNAGYGTRRYTQELIEWSKRYDPDVIHLHNIHGYYINVQLLFDYLKNADKKVVWTLHDCWPFTGHCTYFDRVGCEKWKKQCKDCNYTYAYPNCFFKSDVSKNFDRKQKTFLGVKDLTIVTPSAWLAELVNQSFLKQYPVKVIHNGIDTNIFKPTESDFRKKYGLEEKILVLGVTSGWTERKGLSDFIKLSETLDDRYQVVIVGVQKGDIKGTHEKLIAIGKTNSAEELAEIYSAADIFLNLTYEDNYPTVNLEAQACGTPVVTYNTGGSIESVPSENIVEQGDVDGVIRKIESYKALKVIREKAFLDKYCLFNEYVEIYRTK